MPVHSRAQRYAPWGRRLRRHLALGLVGAVLMAGLVSALHGSGTAFRLSMASAYVGLLFLCASLVLGPWNVLRGHANPVSTGLRRDVGIWAALLGLVHVGTGLQVHMLGNFWLYFLYPPNSPHTFPLRHDLFGFANFTGLGATLVLVLLLVLSNDLSLRSLGTRRWKALQRWNYVNFALVSAHSAGYQLFEQRQLLFVGVFSTMVLGVAAVQFAGFREKRLRSRVAAVHGGGAGVNGS